MPDDSLVQPRNVVPKALTVLLFVSLLAGQYSTERFGVANPLVIPERLFVLGILAFLVLALSSIERRNYRRTRYGLIIAAPTLYALTTALWGADVPDFWPTVADLICILLALVVTTALLRWERDACISALLWCMAGTGIVFSIAGLANLATGDRVAVFGGGPNVFARITMLGFVALVALVLLRRIPTAALAMAPLPLIATVLSGSRGGMLAALVAIYLMMRVAWKSSARQQLGGGIILALCMVAAYRRFADSVEQTIQDRVVEMTFQQGYSGGREQLLRGSLELFDANQLLGAGLRGFEAYFGQGFTYPHNLILQIGCEGGMLGLAILTCTGIAVARALFRHRRELLTRTFMAAASIIFVSSMFSGDYYDARFLWVFLLVAVNSSDFVWAADSAAKLPARRAVRRDHAQREAPSRETSSARSLTGRGLPHEIKFDARRA